MIPVTKLYQFLNSIIGDYKMKNINTTFLSIIFLLSTHFLFSCESKEPNTIDRQNVNPIKSFYFSFPNDNKEFSTELSYLYKETIVVDFPYSYPEESTQKVDLSKMKFSLTLEPGVSLVSPIDEYVDLTKPYKVEVINADKQLQTVFFEAEIESTDKFIISKGVNVASWLSTPKYSNEQRAAFFTEENVKQLKELGFDHIRLPIDEEVLWSQNGQPIRPYAFDLLHEVIGWCEKHGLKIIVDMHITRNHSFTNTENLLFTDPDEPAKFVKLWESLSSELSKYPNSLLAYEILNEPVSADPENWNRILDLVIPAIQAKEPDRTIIVGVCTSNFTVMYKNLRLPTKQNILMTFHFYAPYLLTAYGQDDTTGGKTDIPISYPGQLVPDNYIHELPDKWQSTGKQTFNKEILRPFMAAGINKAKELGVPVFVGEYGTLYTVPEPSRSNWYRDVISLMDEYNVGYTSWDYKGAGYSIVNENNEIIYPEIVKIMTAQ
jgi:endoglucanase